MAEVNRRVVSIRAMTLLKPDDKAALIIVDFQHDFSDPSGALYVKGGETLSNGIVQVLSLPFAYKVATMDNHPSDHISFATTHGREAFENLTLHAHELPSELQDKISHDTPDKFEQTLWPSHCVANTQGARLLPDLEAAQSIPKTQYDVVIKGTNRATECYSAFKTVWGWDETDLDQRLRDRKITHVFLVGLAGDYCVYWTAKDASSLGYKTYVVTDLVKNISDDTDKLKAKLKEKNVDTVMSAELIAALS